MSSTWTYTFDFSHSNTKGWRAVYGSDNQPRATYIPTGWSSIYNHACFRSVEARIAYALPSPATFTKIILTYSATVPVTQIAAFNFALQGNGPAGNNQIITLTGNVTTNNLRTDLVRSPNGFGAFTLHSIVFEGTGSNPFAAWCHEFDFAQGTQGWELFPDAGSYQSGTGYVQGVRYSLGWYYTGVLISRTFTDSLITSVDVFYDADAGEGGNNARFQYIGVSNNGLEFGGYLGNAHPGVFGTNSTATWTSGGVADRIGLDFRSGVSQTPGIKGSMVVKRVMVRGLGATPFPYVFDASNVTYFRAPITNNPPENDLNYSISGGFRYRAYERFIDYEGQWWVAIAGLEQNGTPIADATIDAAVAAGKGGLWIKIPTPPAGESECSPLKGLPISSRYTIPDVPWNTFTGTFAAWPFDIAAMCNAATTPREIHALGINPEGVSYPRATHPGVDLFVPDTLTNLQITSMSHGIIVGIGKGNDTTNTHASWGASNQTDANGQTIPGYSVIIRHGHLYVLYGHLSSVSNDIWVGASVNEGTVIGILGKFNTRHLHLEVHSYGETIEDGIDPPFSLLIGATGILPVAPTGATIIAPYLYDVMQLLPNPSSYTGATSIRDLVATDSLTQITVGTEIEGRVNISLRSGCDFLYRTEYPDSSSILIESADEYRGFVEYPDESRPLPSPLTQTSQP